MANAYSAVVLLSLPHTVLLSFFWYTPSSRCVWWHTFLSRKWQNKFGLWLTGAVGRPLFQHFSTRGKFSRERKRIRKDRGPKTETQNNILKWVVQEKSGKMWKNFPPDQFLHKQKNINFSALFIFNYLGFRFAHKFIHDFSSLAHRFFFLSLSAGSLPELYPRVGTSNARNAARLRHQCIPATVPGVRHQRQQLLRRVGKTGPGRLSVRSGPQLDGGLCR